MGKIKINWGTGLVIGMVLFIGFILFLVIKMTTDDRYSYELVEEDYFKQELLLEDKLLARKNFAALNVPIGSSRTEQGLELTFPDTLLTQQLIGTVSLYRPSNKQLDFTIPLQISGANLLIPKDRLVDGRWNISVQFTYNDKPHLYEEKIYY